MSERMSLQAVEMLRRARLFAQYLGHDVISPVHLLAGYMVVEPSHRWPHTRVRALKVFEEIFSSTAYGTYQDYNPLPELPQRDPEVVAIIQSAIEAAAAKGQDQKIEARDLMIAMLEANQNHATKIISDVTRLDPQELLKSLREQPV